jgi:cation diffusion facilitator CzcD-associated flavoprotein CzcO
MSAENAAFMPEMPAFTTPTDFLGRSEMRPPRSLAELELAVKRDLDIIRYPIKAWVLPKFTPRGERAYDVLIVGGGQSGLAAAFALQRQRVHNIVVIDENPIGCEGPWATYGRMRSLRSEKYVGGMDLGLPSVSIRAWFEAQYGLKAWEVLSKLPKQHLQQYLQWYRRVLGLPVRNQCRMLSFRPEASTGLIAVDVDEGGEKKTLWTRKLVFATGIEGNGIRNVPDFIAENLPKDRWAHSHEVIDFKALAGRRVAVLGGAASAFDNAAMAAEAGAREVHLFHRRKELNPANPVAWGQFNGFLEHFADLDVASRWRFISHIHSFKPAPPSETIARVRNLPNITIHAGENWTDAALVEDKVRLQATDGAQDVDFAVLGTGYVLDITKREELAVYAPLIALWRDVYTPRAGEENDNLGQAPYLGPHFEFQEKVPGTASWLNSVFNFSRGAQLSMGTMAIGLSGIKFGAPRLAHGVTKQLFCEDVGLYFDGMNLWQESGVSTEE